jgi:hypothetical protein
MSQVYQSGVLYINGLPAVHAGPGGHAIAQEECWVTHRGSKNKTSLHTSRSRHCEEVPRRSNPEKTILDCFVGVPPRNDETFRDFHPKLRLS